jgi:t-SNARE complex subunit (syntaxin)
MVITVFGWTTIAVRSEVKRRLREFMERRGIRSPNDAIAFLLDFYEENSRLDRVYKEIEKMIVIHKELHQLAKQVFREQEEKLREAIEKLVSVTTAVTREPKQELKSSEDSSS